MPTTERRIERLEDDRNGNESGHGGRKTGLRTAQNRLARRYRLLTAACLGLCVAQAGLLQDSFFSEWTRRLAPIAFGLLACHNGYTWWCVSRIDLYRQNLREVLKALLRQERAVREPRMFAGCLIALPFLCSLAADVYRFSGTRTGGYAVAGLLGGALAGTFIGLNVRRRVLQDFRKMKERLEEEIGE